MTSLRDLDFSFVKVSPEFCDSFCKEMKHLVNLEKLTLSGTHIGRSCRYITEAIEARRPDAALRKFVSVPCQIPVQMCVPLISALSKCSNLTKLRLCGNKFLDTYQHLPTNIDTTYRHFQSIKSIIVDNFKMSSSTCGAILLAISNCPHLELIFMSGNTLTGSLQRFLAEP